MKDRTIVATGLSLFFTILAASAARADSAWHTVSGTVCHASNNTNVWSTNDRAFYAGSDMWADCPIPRDNVGNTNGLALGLYGGQAQFVSGSYCTARSEATNGGGIYRATSLNLPTYNSGTNDINWGSSLGAGGGWGIYTLECWMKNGAYISQINWVEH